MSEKPIYIHYGHDRFETPNPITNYIHWIKPCGGLWASRKDDPYGWRAWCEREEFRLESLDKHFEFTLKDGAKVLELNNPQQLHDLPKVDSPLISFSHMGTGMCNLDFEKLAETYDAIEVTDIFNLYWYLYGWDCNSILILNPEVVEVVEEATTV